MDPEADESESRFASHRLMCRRFSIPAQRWGARRSHDSEPLKQKRPQPSSGSKSNDGAGSKGTELIMDSLQHQRQDHQQNSTTGVSGRLRGFDLDRARRLLGEVEAVMREARTSGDPRVILDALRVLSLQPANVRELFSPV
jgi:hypothetical protein